MYTKVSSTEFHAHTDLPDWRVILRHIEAGFRASTFVGASVFIGRVANAAEAAGHHPDIELRYPGHVHVTLTTHATNSLTDSDVELARTISALAAAGGLASEPLHALGVEVGIDAIDIDAVRPFWRALVDYVEEPASRPGDQVTALLDPLRIGPAFWFQQMDFPAPPTPPPPHRRDRAPRRRGAGGGPTPRPGRPPAPKQGGWCFLGSPRPQGGKACVCTWQDRD